jgi:NADH-quinone oxidoreductase subunit J
MATAIGLLFGFVGVTAIGQGITGAVTGLKAANGDGNTYGVAKLLFGPYVLAFELTSALLITAALGAMVLAHRERLAGRLSQADLARRRLLDYANSGRHPGNPPTPGVFARHNAVDTPALLPDGRPLEESISSSLVARGQLREGFDDDIDDMNRQLGSGEESPTPRENTEGQK